LASIPLPAVAELACRRVVTAIGRTTSFRAGQAQHLCQSAVALPGGHAGAPGTTSLSVSVDIAVVHVLVVLLLGCFSRLMSVL